MNSATIKTIIGFFKTMIGKYTSLDVGKNYLEGIYNYRKYSDALCTSGQPTEGQFKLIKEAGFDYVINLAPHSAENALPDETKTTSELNISYTHIPVDFKNPTEADFEQFVRSYQKCGENKVWVHCAANMRVSAFLYKYRRDVLGMPEREAKEIMDTVWEPFGVWQEFLK